MYGLTNSVNVTTEEGCGDIVTAVNNTGAALSVGDKVWLNKHNLDENTASQVVLKNKSGIRPCTFFDGSDIYDYGLDYDDGYLYQAVYNPTEKSWERVQLYKASGQPGKLGIKYIDGYPVAFGMRGSSSGKTYYPHIILRKQNPVNITGYFLGNGEVYDAVSHSICAFDPETGTIGEAVCSIGTGDLYGVYKDGNTVLLRDYYNFMFYDITDKENPVLLKSVENNGRYVSYLTGLQAGDYVFLISSDKTGYYNPPNTVMLQLTEDCSFIEPQNVPETLAAVLNTVCTMCLRDDILTVGTVDNVYAYRLENGVFVDLGLTITLPDSTDAGVKYEGYPYVFQISPDLTTATIGYGSQNNGVYTSLVYYKLTTSSEGWFAEKFAEATPYSLTGFAMEAAAAGEDAEVSVVIPETVNLTLNINPTPDVIEFKGEAE